MNPRKSDIEIINFTFTKKHDLKMEKEMNSEFHPVDLRYKHWFWQMLKHVNQTLKSYLYDMDL